MLLAEASHVTERVSSGLCCVSHRIEAYLLTPPYQIERCEHVPDEGQDGGRKEIKRFAEFP